MAKPLIIIGAGASHDYRTYERPSPLTDHLVNPDRLSESLLVQYEGVGALFSSLQPVVARGEKGFEQLLSDIVSESGQLEHRVSQLIALHFYLRDLFTEISSKRHEINNYAALIGAIRDYADGTACVISLNYDSLFESELWSQEQRAIATYMHVQQPIQVIKPHGSHDWAYLYRPHPSIYEREESARDAFQWAKISPVIFNQLKTDSGNLHHAQEIAMASSQLEGLLQYPALALPLPGKQEFICPASHVNAFKNQSADFDRLLVVGWRANDRGIIDLLKETLCDRPLKLLVVSGSEEGAKSIADRLTKELPNLRANSSGHGFSGFVGSSLMKEFFVNKA